MANYDIAAIREFMFCAWPQTRMERLFLQLLKKKMTSLNKFPPLNYNKTLNPLFSFPNKFSEKFLPTKKSCLKSWSPPPLNNGGGEETMGCVLRFHCDKNLEKLLNSFCVVI